MSNKIHLAGIIPVANMSTNLDLHIPAVMLPISHNWTAIQKSVFECAMAGCNTIWIVANDDLAPLVRKVIGDWIYDPVYLSGYSKFSSEQRKEIPIYYAQINPKDRDRRDSYGWSALYGAYSAWKVANRISQWITPDKYYVSFPMAIYDIYHIRDCRKQINHRCDNFFLSYDGETVKDNKPLAFTFTGEDFKQCRRSVNKLTTREYLPPSPDSPYPNQKLPLRERWSARHFDLQTVFQKVTTKNSTTLNVDWYYDISDWEEYKKFLGSSFSIKIPDRELTKARKHVTIPYNSEG